MMSVMSDLKTLCPGCGSYLSSVGIAFRDGKPCPQCGYAAPLIPPVVNTAICGDVTRFEVIDETSQRVYTRYGVEIELHLQDEGRTLKVRMKKRPGAWTQYPLGLASPAQIAGVTAAVRGRLLYDELHPHETRQ